MEEQMTMRLEGVSASEWDWVRRLIADVQEQERHEHLVALWAQWRIAVRFFRQAEFILMRQKQPGAVDFKFHRACLTGLISIGEFLLLHIAESGDREELSRLGFSGENAEAALATLRSNWDEWHGESSPDRIRSIQQKLLELNGEAQAH
ncbi:MAG TPA: hypothetical protein DIT64_09995 [Verrucomicrobiales bacterium]|nr:hypothetical protein [Verrucomicrobiales bacterium]HCN77286.1 hypothetical protein [Verrucomicrobiales bacterium]